jgi:hypothetical protein
MNGDALARARQNDDRDAGRSARIETRRLPTTALEQILALCAIPTVAVSEVLVAEVRAALQERQQN